MSFLNFILLPMGAAAIAVPIIIHLLNKRKFQRVTWAAMRFLQVSVQANERRLKMEDLLLLILRCLLLLLLGLALARPALKSATAGFFGQSGVSAVVIVDQSYSMSQNDGTGSRFDKAKTAAAQVIDALPSGSSASVWLSSDTVNAVIPEPTFDLNLARASIKSAQLCDRRTDVMPALRRALDMLAGHAGLRKEIYLITDGQQSGWKQIDEIRKMLDGSKQDVQSHIIFINSHEEQNLGIADLRQVSGLAAVDHSLRFSAAIANYGSADAHDVHVSLKVDGGADSADEASIPLIPAHDSRGVSLFTKLHGEGYHSITASLAPDRLPADDTRTIVVRAVGKVKVLLVDGNPGLSDRESEVFYLKNLFGATAAVTDAPPDAAVDQRLVQTTVVAPTEVATTNLDEFDAIVLGDVPDFSPATLEAFSSYLQRGGGLMVFPGDQMHAAFYNDQLLGKYHFLPASYGMAKGDPNAQQKLISLADKGFDNPISAIWNDAAAGTPSVASFFKIMPLALDGSAEGAGDPKVVMRFSDLTPAVAERTWGQGRVIQFASTASTRWNDLPVHPGIYVPLIYRCLGAIVGRQDEGLNVGAGEKFIFHPGIELVGKDATISRPNQDPNTPKDSRRIEVVQRLPTLTYDDTDVAGTYDITIPDAPPMKFASQPDSSESQLEDLTDGDKKSLDGPAVVIDWTPGMSLEQEMAKRRLGTELWMPIAAIVLALAAAETFLASWFSRSK